jgi:hypothetical protein
MSYAFKGPTGGALVLLAFLRQEICRSTLSGRVSPRFRSISSDRATTWLTTEMEAEIERGARIRPCASDASANAGSARGGGARALRSLL